MQAYRGIVALVTTTALVWCGVTRVGATTSEGAALLALTNQARASVGATALSPDAALSTVARWWAQNMAGDHAVSHNPELASQIANWSRLAENVGAGSSVDEVHDALLASPDHYANLTNPAYSLVGIGVASAGGRLYVVEDFGAPAGGHTTRRPNPEPPPPLPREGPTTIAPAPDQPAPRTVAPPPPVSATPPQPPAAASTISFVLDALRVLDTGHHPH